MIQTPPRSRLAPSLSAALTPAADCGVAAYVLSPTFGRSGVLSPLYRGDVGALLVEETREPMQPNTSTLSPENEVLSACYYIPTSFLLCKNGNIFFHVKSNFQLKRYHNPSNNITSNLAYPFYLGTSLQAIYSTSSCYIILKIDFLYQHFHQSPGQPQSFSEFKLQVLHPSGKHLDLQTLLPEKFNYPLALALTTTQTPLRATQTAAATPATKSGTWFRSGYSNPLEVPY